MANLLTILLLAIFLEAIEFIFYVYLIRKCEKNVHWVRRGVVGFVIIFIVISFFSGFYIVNTNEGVIYKGLSGNTKIKTSPGIKYQIPFVTSIKNYDLRNTYLTYPTDSNPVNLPTEDNQIVLVAGTMYYKIENLNDFAVNNFNTEPQIYNYLTSLIKNQIKSNEKESLIKGHQLLEKYIIDEMNIFGKTKGIKVSNFKFTNFAETKDVIDANNYKQSTNIRSLADKESNEMLQSSLNKYTPSQLDYLKTKILSENQNIKWVLQNGGQAIVNAN